ncbi:hypothetical protein C7402_111140 [Paraburkholderia unamae]|uniref:Uncharacterized protein n=2 Tax=Paraburkholderia unamae TaxID=219649 RepID=A0ABX5KLC4_9BURK|nr:hypothetical protein C7402_111140 [Paraburkholderia unamae]CAG9246567.1 hypothetical protein PUN4_1160008 [Paraburkholderia unamae]
MQKKDIESGGNGEPGEVSIHKFGPHLFGFSIDEYSTGEGYTQQVRSIYLPYGDKLIEAAPHISLELDNSGTYECGEMYSQCRERHFTITPDTGSQGKIYPLKIAETDTRGDRSVNITYNVTFDPEQGRYLVPKALSEGF